MKMFLPSSVLLLCSYFLSTVGPISCFKYFLRGVSKRRERCCYSSFFLSDETASRTLLDIENRNLKLLEHIEGDILNFELYDKMIPSVLIKLLRRLPKEFRPKPIGKAGMRTYGAKATTEMKRIIFEMFPSTLEVDSSVEHPTIGVFIFMFVESRRRGENIGDILLQLSFIECAKNRYNYMLLVHDDNGSGKLIQYYKNRGFKSIHEFISKGMLLKLS